MYSLVRVLSAVANFSVKQLKFEFLLIYHTEFSFRVLKIKLVRIDIFRLPFPLIKIWRLS